MTGMRRFCVLIGCVLSLAVGPAVAFEGREHGGPGRGGPEGRGPGGPEFHPPVREAGFPDGHGHPAPVHDWSGPYRAEQWHFDGRFNHAHYYPSAGFTVQSLPLGHIVAPFGRDRFFFHAGVWYQPGPGGYVVVRPPIGVVIPVLPPAYSVIWVGRIPYYYANDVYYAQAQGGYAVVAPPSPGSYTLAPAVSGTAPAQTVPPPAGVWYFCASANTYYPYVATCPEGWRPVRATPPGG